MARFLNFLKTMISGKEYSFTVAKSFRGFKSFPMEVYLDQEARDNNYLFRSVNVVGMPLVFKDVSPDRIDVILNNLKIGYISEDKCLKALRGNQISDFGIKFEEDHIFDAEKSEYRYRAHLFAKYI